ncbi:hypothetical protein GCM10010919_14230 [Alishewanella longhuensis]|uniref:RDD domain-containing protein n=1 Tax=Alishewanella longhuensis TaxID=1091037 RepID=A0ABQ3KZF7_9ALTE|nr:RDD family protein [Alishewanella longhuensis]GHG66500.1 hypothetical protein GCM10010919_14230 [Alishewanella longhuensis]
MDFKIDYSRYSLDELYSAAESIDRQAYPDRANEIDKLLREKLKLVESTNQAEAANLAGTQATRQDRLFAVIIDGAINATASIPFIYYYGLESFKDPTLLLAAISIIYGFLTVAIFHGYLIYSYGQTIGKYLMSIRIENLDGTKASWKRIVLLRMLPIVLIHQLAFIGMVIAGIINPILIFGKERRCLHDYIAKTKVSYTGC